ncbi:MAG TPA: TolC family protein, partial [Prolixibacteraceae bacterium]|nr:TolC family protein [Prolixibacteraceae bacterium]
MKQQALILIFLLLTGFIARSQEPLRLSLSEAVDYAVEHNKTLQNAKLDVKASELKVKETISQGLPQIDAGVDFTTYFGYEMAFKLGGGSGNYTEQQLTEAWQQTSAQFPAFTQADLMNYMAGSTYTGILSAMNPMAIKMT